MKNICIFVCQYRYRQRLKGLGGEWHEAGDGHWKPVLEPLLGTEIMFHKI